MFDLVRLSCALVDESPHQFRVRTTQIVALLHFGIPIELRVADRDKMRQTNCIASKRRDDSLLTTRDIAIFGFRRMRSTG
jgi:hypothetical protein